MVGSIEDELFQLEVASEHFNAALPSELLLVESAVHTHVGNDVEGDFSHFKTIFDFISDQVQ